MPNCLPRIQILWTNLGTIHYGVTQMQVEGIIQLSQPFIPKVIPQVLDPTVGLHEDGWSEAFVCVPPVQEASHGAAGTNFLESAIKP